jgi:type I restriction enzyme S subunit
MLRGSSLETLGRVDEAAHGTTVLRMESWTSMVLPLPPVAEQRMIVKEIERAVEQLDALGRDVQHAIDLLQERRTALISAAVTGQIDVRELQAEN